MIDDEKRKANSFKQLHTCKGNVPWFRDLNKSDCDHNSTWVYLSAMINANANNFGGSSIDLQQPE